MLTREEAIKAIEYIRHVGNGEVPYKNDRQSLALDMAIEALQERKTGKWIIVHPLQEDDGGAYMCSCCKSGSYDVIPKTWKACPWCTALMEVDNADSD